MTHSFYAGMGGFVANTKSQSSPSFIAENPRLSFTARGLLFVAEHDYDALYISESSIKDRSKADGFAKLLVCLQAGYIIVQCAGRLAARLPITLLEVNTLARSLCFDHVSLLAQETPR